jgi:hypothetical protein
VLGFPPTLALTTAGLRLFLGLAATTVGLMLLSLGLGFYLLARNRTAAGLASIRLGSTRLVATGAAILLVVYAVELRSLDPTVVLGLLGAGAGLQIVLAAFRMRRDRSAAALPTATAPGNSSRKRQPRKKSSAQGELA